MRSTYTAVMALVCAAGSAAHADILWDQSALNTGPNGVGMANSVSPGFNGVIAFAMSDITVPAPGWNVQSITTYFSALSWFDGSVTDAVLNIFPKTGGSPIAGNDPRVSPFGSGTLVPVTMTQVVVDAQGVNQVRASGLNLNLAAGDYWIGLTPVGPTGPFGPDYQWSTTSVVGAGQHVRFYDPDSGWLDEGALYTSAPLDGAILVEGVVPAPSSIALLGLGALAARRRRR